MIKFRDGILMLSVSIFLIACGGGGSGSNGGNGNPVVTPTMPATIVTVNQVGTSDQFEPNNQTYLDFKPYGQYQYFYAYVTNNQTVPLFSLLKSGSTIYGSGGPGGVYEIESTLSDPQSCDNYTQTNPLPINGTCRALVYTRAANTYSTYGFNGSGTNESMSYTINFNLGGSAYPCNGCGWNGINAGEGPTVKASFPAQVGLWMLASESSNYIQAIQENNAFFTPSPSGNYLYFDNLTNTSISLPAKYQVTWRSDGSPWVDINSPSQTWPASILSPQRSVFYGLQMDGTQDCTNCIPYAQNYDLTPSNPQSAIYNYATSQWYSLNGWINQDAVHLSYNSVFISGLDNNEYVSYTDLSGVAHYYKLNQAGDLTAINTYGYDFEVVAQNGTLIGKTGCLTTSDNVNYNFTPFKNANLPANAVPYYSSSTQVGIGEQILDASTCTLNNHITGGALPAGYSQTPKEPLTTAKGVFAVYGQNIIYYPYPSSN